MKTWPAALAVLWAAATASADAWAAEPDDWSTTLSGQAWIYGERRTPVAGSITTPGADAVTRWVLDTRIDYLLERGGTAIVLKPRFLREAGQGAAGAEAGSDLFLAQAFVRQRVGDRFSVSAGRELLTWGPANFRSPSNPLYFDPGKTRPLQEVPGVDVVRATAVLERTSHTLCYVHGGRGPDDDIRNSVFLKSDYRAGDSVVSGIIDRAPRGIFLGAYGQRTLGDAWLVYAEAGSSPPSALSQGVAGPAQASRTTSWLAGTTYTFEDGRSLSFELLHDSRGLSREGERALFQLLDRIPPAARQGGPATAQGTGLLGRNYAYALLQSSLQDTARYWRASWTQNVDDGSGALLLYGERSVTPRVTIFGSLLVNAGGPRQEFGAAVRTVFSAGVKIFLF